MSNTNTDSCPTCHGATGFISRRGTIDVCDDPWHEAVKQRKPRRAPIGAVLPEKEETEGERDAQHMNGVRW